MKKEVKRTLVSLFGNNKYKKLIIVARSRTGSNLLASLLNSHPKIEVRGEVFSRIKQASCRTVWNKVFSKRLPWIKYLGFKIFYDHPIDSDDKEVWDFIKKDVDIRIIHLKRRNILRSHVSRLIALKTDKWTSTQNNEPAENESRAVEVDTGHCIDQFQQLEKWQNDHDKRSFSQHEYLEVIYEELASEPQKIMNEVFDFLQLPRRKVETKLKRQNPEPLNLLIKNYSEVKKVLEEKGYAHFLIENKTGNIL